jgi:tetratricopeptide (TPR) repeat protein
VDRASGLVSVALRNGAGDVFDRGHLGIIHYRKGRFAEAVASLEQAIAGQADPVERARWRIFLAMSQRRLGQSRNVQQSYDRAWSELAVAKSAAPSADDFARLRAEADAVMRDGHDPP